jgi:long-chain acyl-CoA synthetase
MNYDDKVWLKHYDEWVKPIISFPDITLIDMMERIFKDYPDRPAYHFLGVTGTYRELDQQSRRFAQYLIEKGCKPGDIVGLCTPNIPQFLIAFLGSLRAGCVVTGISLLLTPKELAYQINDSDAKVLVTLDALFERNFLQIKDEVPELKHIVVTNIADFLPAPKRFLGKLLKKIPTGTIVPVAGKEVISFMDILRDYPAERPEVNITGDNSALIYYTGGTTGPPKGAELSHWNMITNVIIIGEWCNFEMGTETFCSAFPFFHLAGTAVYLYALYYGATYILIPDPRNTGHICKEIEKYHPTVLVNVPSLYMMLLADPAFAKLDHSYSKLYFSAAAPLAEETIKALEDVIGKGKMVEGYGMTETGPLQSLNPVGRTKPGTVGTPLSNVRLKLVDLEGGTKEVPIGEEGEIIVQTPSLMKGYHNKPEETANAIREFEGEKWMYTGDVARMDEEGYLSIVDRSKDMIIVSGFKVFSREVEDKLYDHPAVELCALVGVPNPDRPGSELVKAFIQLAPEYREKDHKKLKEEIISFARENMAPYKVPKSVEFIDEIPLTSVGKVDKKALR